MRRMTRDDLVQAVRDLTRSVGPLVDRPSIEDWSRRHNIDIGQGETRKNTFVEAADHGEAASGHRLAKFKQGTSRTDPVAWCLVAQLPAARAAAKKSGGWRELPFDRTRGRWRWR